MAAELLLLLSLVPVFCARLSDPCYLLIGEAMCINPAYLVEEMSFSVIPVKLAPHLMQGRESMGDSSESARLVQA